MHLQRQDLSRKSLSAKVEIVSASTAKLINKYLYNNCTHVLLYHVEFAFKYSYAV
jgi:hypothetical protein